jgi:hypothetical protein
MGHLRFRMFVVLSWICAFAGLAPEGLGTMIMTTPTSTKEWLDTHTRDEWYAAILFHHDPKGGHSDLKWIILRIGQGAGAEDVPRLASIFSYLHGELEHPVQDTPDLIMRIFQVMSRNGIVDARIELRKMLRPEYWARFDFICRQSKQPIDHSTMMAVSALGYYAEADDPEFVQIATRSIDSLPVSEKSWLLRRLPQAISAFELRTQALASGNPQAFMDEYVRNRLQEAKDHRENRRSVLLWVILIGGVSLSWSIWKLAKLRRWFDTGRFSG